MTIAELLQEYGYWLILGWTLVEGETIVIIAGIAAAAGHMKLWMIILVAWIGSYCGDQIYFTIGKRYGPALLRKFPWAQGPVDRAGRLLNKYDIWFILTFRFLYGVRNVTPPALALAGVPHRRFAFLNFFAAGLWAVSFAGAGYLFGQAFKSVLDDAHKYFGFVILGLFILAVAWGLYHTIRAVVKRQRAYAREEAKDSSPIKPGKPKASKRPAADPRS